MPIKIYTEKISFENLQKIINYYNEKKEPNSPKIHYLNCGNGGFIIYDKKIKQMRWYYHVLVGYYNYPTFTMEEEYLLYQAMQNTLGTENVTFYNSCSDAIAKSPSFCAVEV